MLWYNVLIHPEHMEKMDRVTLVTSVHRSFCHNEKACCEQVTPY